MSRQSSVGEGFQYLLLIIAAIIFGLSTAVESEIDDLEKQVKDCQAAAPEVPRG